MPSQHQEHHLKSKMAEGGALSETDGVRVKQYNFFKPAYLSPRRDPPTVVPDIDEAEEDEVMSLSYMDSAFKDISGNGLLKKKVSR